MLTYQVRIKELDFVRSKEPFQEPCCPHLQTNITLFISFYVQLIPPSLFKRISILDLCTQDMARRQSRVEDIHEKQALVFLNNTCLRQFYYRFVGQVRIRHKFSRGLELFYQLHAGDQVQVDIGMFI
jgi:hypothetical protein